jgi:hypothetical protein
MLSGLDFEICKATVSVVILERGFELNACLSFSSYFFRKIIASSSFLL